jgi:hypothetical protein
MFADIHSINQNAIKKMVELLKLKGYSNSTIKTYQNEFAQFLTALKDYPVDGCDAEKLYALLL